MAKRQLDLDDIIVANDCKRRIITTLWCCFNRDIKLELYGVDWDVKTGFDSEISSPLNFFFLKTRHFPLEIDTWSNMRVFFAQNCNNDGYLEK